MSKVYTEPMSGCWLWGAAVNHGGYGVVSGGLAHRASWILHVGLIPLGMCVCHSCDNPPCVNPAHLFLGTRHDNNADRHRKGRTRVGVGDRCKHTKINPEIVRMIRARHAAGESQQSIADDVGIAQSNVSAIVLRKKWRYVD